MNRKTHKRSLKNVRLTRRFHFRFFGLWIVLTSCLVVALNLLLYQLLKTAWQTPNAGSPSYGEFSFIQQGWIILMMIVTIIFVTAIAALAMVTAHRIAGPFIKLNRTFQEIRDGDRTVRLKFRSEDRLDDLADLFNEMMQALCSDVEKPVSTISEQESSRDLQEITR